MNYLFIKIPNITIIDPNIVPRYMSPSRKNSKSLYCCPEVLTFMLKLFLTLGFITSLCGIYAPSSRIRANILLLSKYSRVNIILFPFLCLSIGKKESSLNIAYTTFVSFFYIFIHSFFKCQLDTFSVKLSLPNH